MSPCTNITLRRKMYVHRYELPRSLSYTRGEKNCLSVHLLWQLDHCADEEARRILLGVSA
jgi:hypothetical protein